MSKETKSIEPKFIVTLREPSRSADRYGHSLFYFASEVFKAIEEAGGEVEFSTRNDEI
ncbi:hypothetical protein [Pantoea sp. 3_1284]|uniref:hypothetical protein n=1 Tax=Pantoea sp. 3_1284 TaxID=2259618 RepID=UPI001314732E|nr:hypothetical protein [Pantoea sp. 3_1284]